MNKSFGIKTIQPYCLKAVPQRKYIALECLKPVFYKFNGHVIVAELYKKEEDWILFQMGRYNHDETFGNVSLVF